MKKQMPGGKWSVPGDGNGKAVIILDIGDNQVRKHENSHFSRILGFWPLFGSNLLPCNPFQLKQTNGFLGFPENFSGVWYTGGEGQKILIVILIPYQGCQTARRQSL
ncbi:MAG: hypothetical protein ACLQU4_11180 [Limisphaerales bacterium]